MERHCRHQISLRFKDGTGRLHIFLSVLKLNQNTLHNFTSGRVVKLKVIVKAFNFNFAVKLRVL